MKKILIAAIFSLCLISCKNNHITQGANIKNLDEVEFFYLEYLPRGVAVHVNKNCSDNQSVYLEKSQIIQYGDFLCSKCVSLELAKEIHEK